MLILCIATVAALGLVILRAVAAGRTGNLVSVTGDAAWARGSADACLDANSIVAIAAGDPRRLARHESHLDACDECRAIVSGLVDGDPAGAGALAPRFFSGQRIGRFTLIEPRGAGGMGLVFEARDTVLDRRVALKLVRVGRAVKPERAREALLRESRALARLNHPNVVTLYDVACHGEELYIAMELVEGQTLAAWLATSHEPLELLSVFRQAGRGLAAIHAAGQIHRDIKPANILIGDDGRVRVSDFGLAVERTASDGALASTIAGTPSYMAPELRAGGPATERSDQWSLAATFRDAIATSGAIRSARIARRLAPVLERALAGDPGARFASIDELLRALRPGGLRLPLILAALAAVLAGALALVAWPSHERAVLDPCAEVAAPLDAAWGAPQHVALADRIVRAGLPPDAAAALASRVTAALDRQARSWRAIRTSACIAGNRNGREQAEIAARQISCLDRHLVGMHAVIDAVLTSPGMRAIDASDTVLALSPVDDCADAKHLFELEQLPSDPARRGKLLSLQETVETALARFRVTRRLDDLHGPWLDESLAATDYAPLQARALQLVVLRQRTMLDPVASQTARRAQQAAQAAGDEVMQVSAAIDVLDAVSLTPLSPTEAEQARWIAAGAEAQITALQRRMPETAADLRFAWLRTYGAALAVSDHLEDAIGKLREALALARRRYGADDSRSARVAAILSTLVLRAGNYDEAVELVQAAVPAMERVLPARSLDLAGTYLNATYAYHFHGDHERALAYATIAADWLRGTPDEPRVVEFIADIHGAMGHWAAAGQALEAAIAGTHDREVAARLRTRAGCLARAEQLHGRPVLHDALEIATCFMQDRRFHMAVAVLEPILAKLADARPTRPLLELRLRHAQSLAYRGAPGDDVRAEAAAERLRRDCARAPDCGPLTLEINRWIDEMTRGSESHGR